jgi:hypothetical protein
MLILIAENIWKAEQIIKHFQSNSLMVFSSRLNELNLTFCARDNEES